MNPLTGLLRRLAPALCALAQNVHALAMRQGQLRSMRAGRPVDAEGLPLPWYTYPALEYLAQFDFSDSRIFEFGAGSSSTYWAERAAEVISVDSDAGWFERVRAESLSNQRVLLRQQRDSYVGALHEQPGEFDVIVIDGRWRHACTVVAPDKLSEGGLIILDNSDKYPDAARHLRERNLFEIDFSGFGPCNGYTWTTSLFLRADNRLQQRFRDPDPVAGRRAVVHSQDER